MFDAAFFTGNRRALAAAAQTDLIVVSANGQLQKSADSLFPFSQDSSFWYLTGCEVPDAVLVMDLRKGTEFLVTPERQVHRDLWEGAIDLTALQALSGIKNIVGFTEGWRLIKQLGAETAKVGTVVPDGPYIAAYGMHINPAKIAFKNRLRRAVGAGKFVDVRKDIARLRQVKQPAELQAIRQAVKITLDGLQKLRAALPSMHDERDVEVFLTHQFRLGGADGHAYDPIVASGVHAATIHHMINDGPLRTNELLLMDVGAQYQGYAADISRTWVIGAATPRQKAAHAAMQSTHAYALKLLKPGVIIKDYQKEVVTFLVGELISAGLCKTSERAAIEKNYPHLISHFLGLDVHDAGMYDEPLVAGVLLTVEPGVYLPDEKIGVRIEDDILITADGAINLSTSLSSNLL